jgi:hypothetical protein
MGPLVGSEILISIGARYPNPSLVSAQFVENHSPLEVFLAVADIKEPVPEELLAMSSPRAGVVSVGKDFRLRLRRENEMLLAQSDFSSFGTLSFDGGTECAPEFKQWVGTVYGDLTCGVAGAPGEAHFTTTTRAHSYCSRPECDFALGSIDAAQCIPTLESCDIVQGTVQNRRQRLTDWQGDAEMSKHGFMQHYGTANCSGNGDVISLRTRDSSAPVTGAFPSGTISRTVIDHVPVGAMLHFYWGQQGFPAQAEQLVSYGLWARGAGAGDAGYQRNRVLLRSNSGTNDRAILCGDITMGYAMSDQSDAACHGPGVHLCTGGSSCTSACFHCSGGSCQ